MAIDLLSQILGNKSGLRRAFEVEMARNQSPLRQTRTSGRQPSVLPAWLQTRARLEREDAARPGVAQQAQLLYGDVRRGADKRAASHLIVIGAALPQIWRFRALRRCKKAILAACFPSSRPGIAYARHFQRSAGTCMLQWERGRTKKRRRFFARASPGSSPG